MEFGTTQILLIASITVMALVVLITIIDVTRKSKKNKKYIQSFETAYKNNGVCGAFEQMKNEYKVGSQERAAFEKSINYLNNSCLKDYQTAFAMIENIYTGKKIEAFHDKVLETEKQKVVFLLEKMEG